MNLWFKFKPGYQSLKKATYLSTLKISNMNETTYQQIASQLRKPEGEEGIKTGEWMNRGNELMNKAAIAALQIANNDRILEIGMGNGFFVKDIVSVHESVKYVGCDFSDIMTKEAEKNNLVWVENEQAEFRMADVNELPFEDGRFNKILTINTVYFWEEMSNALSEIKRVMTNKGKLVIALRPKHQMEKYPFTKYGFNMFSKEDICRELENNGFIIESVVENKEPDFELNGEVMRMENMVLVAYHANSGNIL